MPTIKLTGLSSLGQITGLGDTDDAQLDSGLIVGNADTDSILINAEFDSHLIPDDDATYDLGSETKRWNIVSAVTYYGDGSNLDGVGTEPAGNDGTIQYNSGGVLDGAGHFYYKNGKVGIGDFENDNPDSLLHIKGNFGGGQTHGTITIEDYGFSPTIYFNRYNNNSESPTGVANPNVLGALYFKGYNPTANGLQTGAQIRALVDGVPSQSANDMPTSLRFGTSSDGTSSPNTRMIIKPTGYVGINTIFPDFTLDVSGTGIRTRQSGGSFLYLATEDTDPYSGLLLGEIRFGGETQAQNSANIAAYTSENWVSTYGSYLTFNTTQNGTTTPNETMRVSETEITLKAPTVIESIATVEETLYVEGSNGVVVNNGSGQVIVRSTQSSFESKMTLSTVETADVLANNLMVNPEMSSSVPNACSLIAYKTGVDAIVVNSGGHSEEGFLIYDANEQVPFSITEYGRTYIGTKSAHQPEYPKWTYPMDISSVHNGVYFEGNNSSGPAFMFANRSTDTSSDGIGILIGKGGYLDGNYPHTLHDYPEDTNAFIIFYAKKKSFGNPNGDPEQNPESIGAIRGDGNGGISIDYSFTGKHATVMVLDETTEIGMIVESTGEIWHNGTAVSTALPKVSLSKTNNSKKVYGVIATLSGNFEGYVSVSPLLENETHIEVNSLGEGKVWVCLLYTSDAADES